MLKGCLHGLKSQLTFLHGWPLIKNGSTALILTSHNLLALLNYTHNHTFFYHCAALVSATCGNGTIEGTDVCDDNDTTTGDGCNDTCQIETGYSCDGEPSICVPVCGDGLIIAPESCDDNDNMTGDGCNDICQMEIGFECSSGEPSMCYPICGDGLILGTEQCDDNSTTTGDGCDDTCQIETGYSCDGGEPSICGSVCGDGIRIIEFEECDDGNLNPSDGCSETCRVILLDLNIPDNTTLSYNNEYFELNEVVFLFDPNNTNLSSFFLSEDGGVSVLCYS